MTIKGISGWPLKYQNDHGVRTTMIISKYDQGNFETNMKMTHGILEDYWTNEDRGNIGMTVGKSTESVEKLFFPG
jgi:hypothetical protein